MMGANYSQMFPGRPHFTEKNLPSLASKVFLVTGGNAGIGLALAKILYSKNATVYIAGRSMEKIKAAIEEIKNEFPLGTGQLKALLVDLADLDSTKAGAAEFLAQETRLDVLFLNAGVAQIPAGTITKHGHEIHMGTNCVGPFLLTQLVLPTLLKTAESEPTGSVRVVWTSSGIIDLDPIQGGLRLEELVAGHHGKVTSQNYTSSKSGNWFLAAELDKRVRNSGVISVTQNPGTINTKGWNVFPWIKLLFKPIMYEAVFGAYTECKRMLLKFYN